jgi:S1-C subfamily serine protease
LKAGDRLTSLDGAAVPDREALARAMAGKRWGDALVLKVQRDKEALSLTVLLRRKGK